MTLIWIMAGFMANMAVGCVAMALMDDERGSLFEWYRSAKTEMGVIGTAIQLLVLQLWFVVLVFWLRRKWLDSRNRP